MRHSIRFAQGRFSALRAQLLQDLSREQFAVLFARSERVGGSFIANVFSVRHTSKNDIISHSAGHVRPSNEFIFEALVDLKSRYDVNTIIDVHTHPFSLDQTFFSSVDDADERRFAKFLFREFENLFYASIVLSQTWYAARFWEIDGRKIVHRPADIRCQSQSELGVNGRNLAQASAKTKNRIVPDDCKEIKAEDFNNRLSLIIGADRLRRVVGTQQIAVVGVGGLGACIAENLVHMGFQQLTLIDPDEVEFSNLSRLVGARFEDAEQRRSKVHVVADHLCRINPSVTILAIRKRIEDKSAEEFVAVADWIVVATDSHASRAHAQMLSMKFFVPMISAGVNITIEKGELKDFSGEVITMRIGDGLCLHCLGRLNPAKIAAERFPFDEIRDLIVDRGYVTGETVGEPAAKTLNAVVAALAVDQLINQLVTEKPHHAIMVYDATTTPRIYPDIESVWRRNKSCYTCGVVD